MATLEQLQGVLDRGLEDQVPTQVKVQFDEALRRGLIKSSVAPTTTPDGRGVPQTGAAALSSQTVAPAPPLNGDGTELPIGELDGDGKIPPQARPFIDVTGDTENQGFVDRAVNALDEAIVAGTESALAIGTAVVAEPIAGARVIFDTIKESLLGDLDIFGEGAKSPESREAGERILKNLESTRKALTFEPRTEEGQAALTAFGKALEPIAKGIQAVESFIGDNTLKATGSPALAALAETAPALATELIGFKGSQFFAKRRTAKADVEVTRDLAEAAPTSPELREAATTIFNEIEDSGVVFKTGPVRTLSNDIVAMAKKMGIDPDLTPKAFKAISRFIAQAKAGPISVQAMETVRRRLAVGAKSIDNDLEKSISLQAIDMVDDFIDSTDTGSLTFVSRATPATPGVVPAGGLPPKQLPDLAKTTPGINLGEKYKVARNLWGRAKRSEMLDETFEKARNQASGFENGVVTGFRAILNNPRKVRFFNESEKNAMKAVVRGEGTKRNLYKFLGRAGGFEGGSTNFLGTIAGTGIGAAMFGPLGAVAVPLIGVFSKRMATRLTQEGARFADQVIRAGKDAKAITQAYRRNTPKSKQNAAELSQLLIEPGIDLSGLVGDNLAIEAAKIAQQNRVAVIEALSLQATIQSNEQRQ